MRAYRRCMDGDVVLGLAIVGVLSFSSAVVLRLLLSSPAIVSWVGDIGLPSLRRRLGGRWGRRVEPPPGRPIEVIASQIRRLGTVYYGGHPGRSWVKTEALRRAYDEALDEGCHALEVDSDLLALEPGTERDAERMRVEHLLAAAGLVMRQRPAA